jgi:hypothetical protein
MYREFRVFSLTIPSVDNVFEFVNRMRTMSPNSIVPDNCNIL